MGRLLDLNGAVDYTGLSESTIRDLVFKRAIPFTKVDRRLRFDVKALDRWIEAKTTQVAS